MEHIRLNASQKCRYSIYLSCRNGKLSLGGYSYCTIPIWLTRL